MSDEIKSLRNENKFYLKKMEKMRKKMKEMEERLLWKEREVKAYEKGAKNNGEFALAREEKIKELKNELQQEKDGRCADLDELERENEKLKLELKAAKEVSVVYMKRYEQKAEEERKIDDICGRIKCDDKFGHLIGKVPTH